MSAIDNVEMTAVQQAAPREVLTLRLGEEEYGIDILRVQEIRSYEPPTRIANAPSHVAGVLNLRGVIVPIFDLRRHFGLPTTVGAATVTVVVNVGSRTFGAIVDAVHDVVALAADQIKPAPALAGTDDARCITEIGVVEAGEGQRMLILLDIALLLALAHAEVAHGQAGLS